MKKSVSIRQSLLASVIIVVVSLTLATIAIEVIAARRIVRELSSGIITQATQHVESKLRRFFDPVINEILAAQAWGEFGVLDLDDPEELNQLFVGIIEGSPQISSLLLADSGGNEHMLMKLGSGEGTVWRNRRTRPEVWEDRVQWLEWGAGVEGVDEKFERTNYTPLERPWFAGGIDLAEHPGDGGLRRRVSWTDPYTFFTTGDPGITASVPFVSPDGVQHVVGVDVLLKDISRFTSELQVTPNSKVFVIAEPQPGDFELIGLPSDESLSTIEDRRRALRKSPNDVGIRLIADMHQSVVDDPEEFAQPAKFKSAGANWWGQANQFHLTPEHTLWIAVVVPESDLLVGVTQVRFLILGASIVVLVLGVIGAVLLADRYGRPVEALVAQSERISRLELDDPHEIHSPIREIQHLAKAQERMRLGLKSLLKLEHDLQIARRIQQKTLPSACPKLPNFEIAAWNEPADETGGDTYDVIGMRSQRKGQSLVVAEDFADEAMLLMADATGHGVGPALSVTQVRAMLRMAVRLGVDVKTIALHINAQLSADLESGRFITAWFGHLDAAAGTLQSFSAGQGPLLHYHAETKQVEVLMADVAPLGIMPELEVTEGNGTPLAKGDLFIVFSDGIFEAPNEKGEQFGDDRVIELIREHAGKPAQKIIDVVRRAVQAHGAGVPRADDQTALIIKCTSEARKAGRPGAQPRGASKSSN